MNEQEQERFEAKLQRASPARVPAQFLTRLKAANPRLEAKTLERHHSTVISPNWWKVACWVAPALAAVVAGLLVVRANMRAATNVVKSPVAASFTPKADDVELNQELISTFDVVAKLPGGEPVRFHCRKWNDQVVVTDTNRGVEIVQNSPRLEVVPVRFETY